MTALSARASSQKMPTAIADCVVGPKRRSTDTLGRPDDDDISVSRYPLNRRLVWMLDAVKRQRY
jgi:hypothetical protein